MSQTLLPNLYTEANAGHQLHENEARSWIASCFIPRERSLAKIQNDMTNWIIYTDLQKGGFRGTHRTPLNPPLGTTW